MARTAATAKPITAAQIKRIHTIVHLLSISDDNYRACLDSRFGVTTSKSLSVHQAHSFITELEKFALDSQNERDKAERTAARQKMEDERPKRFDNLDNRPGMANGSQLRKIEAMWQDISFIPEAEPRGRALRHFIKRIAGVADLRFLDSQAVGKVINALNAIQKQSGSSKTARQATEAYPAQQP